ncbi:restriction endonuclease subunit S [bacterium]|nr:MAG: restriction endonuclease subunit S [bacterium]
MKTINANILKLTRLASVAEVIFSNVDKLTLPDEIWVSLCNYTDVYNNRIIDGRMQFKRGTATPREIERFRLHKGDVVITKDSESANDIAVPAYVAEDIPDLVCGYHLAILRPKIGILDGRFLAQLLQLHHIRQYFATLANGITRFGLGTAAINEAKITFPNIAIQRIIADILSTWDDALEKLDGLIAAKDRRKQALMQQLLTGKKRAKGFDHSNGQTKKDRFGIYPEDWKRVALGNITREVSRRNPSGDSLPVLSCTKHRGLVLSEKYFGKRIYADDTSNYRMVARGEFVYATNHIEEGSIGYQNLCDAGLVSPIYTVFKATEEVDDDYLFRVLKSPLLIHLYRANTSSSVDRRGSLRYDEFAAIHIWLPCQKEQIAIAVILDTCDKELRLLSAQRDALDMQKRGLMQKLLTGAIRVRTEKHD